MDTLGTLGTLTGMLGAPIVNKVKDAFIQDEPTNAADEIIQSFVNDSPAFQTKKFASKGANNKWVVSKVRAGIEGHAIHAAQVILRPSITKS